MKKMKIKELLNKEKLNNGVAMTRRFIKKNKKACACGALALTVMTTSGVVKYNLDADERAEQAAIQAQQEQEQAELEAEIAKQQAEAQARIEAERIRREMVEKADKAKDALLEKGEYSPFTITAEREPEMSTTHNNSFSEWWSKNVLRLHVNYEIKYTIDMDKLSPMVTDEGKVLIEFTKEDFELEVIAKDYSIIDTLEEKGVFPTDFEEEEVVALVNASIDDVYDDYISNDEKLNEAVDTTKEMISDFFASGGVSVSFIDKWTKSEYAEKDK